MNLITLCGSEIRDAIDDLAVLRLTIFREYPYLYGGSKGSEEKYLREYAAHPDGRVVLLKSDGGATIGAATGLPLSGWGGNPASKAFTPYPAESIYYFGEILLLKAFRNIGWGEKLCRTGYDTFNALKYPYLGMFMVVRDPKDPRKPADYRPMDSFARLLGFEPIPNGTLSESWPNLNGEITPNILQAWIQSNPLLKK